MSGHHGNVEKWRREQSILMTAKYRPDMLEKAELTKADREFLKKQDL
jgi:tRNA (guanine37-N1)-methyltransferase